MRKKRLFACICFFMLLTIPVHAESFSLQINGINWTLQTPPAEKDGTDYLSIYDIAAILGASVYHDAEKQEEEWTLIYGTQYFHFHTDETFADVNLEEFTLDAEPFLQNDVLMLPLKETFLLMPDISVTKDEKNGTYALTIPVSEDIISKEEAEKIKDKPTKRIVISYTDNWDLVTFTLTEKENMKMALRAAQVLTHFQNQALVCAPDSISFKIYYEDDTFLKLKFSSVRPLDAVMDPIFQTDEFLMQTDKTLLADQEDSL